MNKVIFKVTSLVLCSVVAISAQQAEQSSPQVLSQQEQQYQPQVQQQQVQTQQYLPPQPQVQQPQPQQQQQMLQPQQTNCPQSIAQPKTGLQAIFNLSSVSYGFLSKKNDNIDMGIGFGAGAIRRIPLTNSLNVNLEASFIHRKLYSEKGESSKRKSNNPNDPGYTVLEKYDYWEDETEFIMSFIPVLVQFTPFEFPLYVAAGFQVDFPMLAKLTTTEKYIDGTSDEYTENYGGRYWYDLGIVLGAGYSITERFSFNLRSVVGVTSVTGKRSDTRTPIQYGLSVDFF